MHDYFPLFFFFWLNLRVPLFFPFFLPLAGWISFLGASRMLGAQTGATYPTTRSARPPGDQCSGFKLRGWLFFLSVWVSAQEKAESYQ